MDIRYTGKALSDLQSMDAQTKMNIKEAIEKLPDGRMRKLMDYSTAYRLQAHGYCIIFEERFKKNQGPVALIIDRKELYNMGVLYVAIHKFIPRPTISWIEEIQSIREGRDDLKHGIVTMHKDVDWN
jgi:mRNA-degrading endonuclease RelE of RelBE toxin-antitoxin system